ncbi:MAG TPA: hypothetical protein VK841_02715 [Polyangiaceae bacterium]|nr:hypothetical protein [Polyangiaceae bacterium]
MASERFFQRCIVDKPTLDDARHCGTRLAKLVEHLTALVTKTVERQEDRFFLAGRRLEAFEEAAQKPSTGSVETVPDSGARRGVAVAIAGPSIAVRAVAVAKAAEAAESAASASSVPGPIAPKAVNKGVCERLAKASAMVPHPAATHHFDRGDDAERPQNKSEHVELSSYFIVRVDSRDGEIDVSPWVESARTQREDS